VTRALKNTKHLQRVASKITPVVEPPEGFASIIPHKVLAQLHTPEGQSAESIDSRLQKLLKDARFPRVSNMSGDPVFYGTLYFVRLLFTVQNQRHLFVGRLRYLRTVFLRRIPYREPRKTGPADSSPSM